MVHKALIKDLPQSPGIYQFFDGNNKLIYVGKSISIKKRVTSYFSIKNLGPKTDQLVSKIADIKYIKVFSEFEALLLESELIRTHKPFYNIISKDDKSPIYIKITNDSIPLITTTRKEKPRRGIFLKGPFPSSKNTKEILRLIRRIFPYCQHKNPPKACLYVHLGLCPYPYAGEQAKHNYLKNIAKIKRLLKGESKGLIRQLTREMNTASKNLYYEQAQIIKKQIEQLQLVTTTYHQPFEFIERPTLVDDQTTKRIKDLADTLELKTPPKRIECYDISNTSGKQATGSMVVFVNGQKAKDQYRRFKIKFLDTPNDFEMIREVLGRRFSPRHNSDGWPKPDLIIIDGGRGQLNAAKSVLNRYKLNIPLISLAKRLEEIYTPDKILPISLPKESPARQLAQELRDEAHRFAITYHRLLRAKNFLK